MAAGGTTTGGGSDGKGVGVGEGAREQEARDSTASVVKILCAKNFMCLDWRISYPIAMVFSRHKAC